MKEGWLGQRILLMLVSLGLSFFLWVIVSGQDLSSFEIAVPLEMTGLPAGLLIDGELPTELRLQIQANPAQRNLIEGRKLRLAVDLSHAVLGENYIPISASNLELPRGVIVSRLTPSGISFDAVGALSKDIPVEARLEGEVDEAYDLKSVSVEPKTVFISGPPEIVGRIKKMNTPPIDIGGLRENRNFTVTVESPQPSPRVVIQPPEVLVSVVVAHKYQNFTLKDLPIIAVGADARNQAGAPVKLAPDKANIVAAAPVGAKNPPQPGDFVVQARVPIAAVERDGQAKAPVSVHSNNPDFKIISVEPSEVVARINVKAEDLNRR